jgi:phage terminase large subunit-like protein
MTLEQTELIPAILGNAVPRIHTPFDEAQKSRGQDLIDLAAEIDEPLLPWQEFVAHNAHKVKDDGRWQYSQIGLLLARQNGKSHLMRMRILTGLILWDEPLQIVAAHKLSIALEHFNQIVDLFENHDYLGKQVKKIRRVNGQEEIQMLSGNRLRVVAANSAGRGLAKCSTAMLDELREYKNNDGWSAISKTQLAAPNPQLWGISNAGDDTSIPLLNLRERGLQTVGGQSDSVAWFEWSAPLGCRVDDWEAIAAANPALGHTIHADNIAGMLKEDESIVRTEILCQFLNTMQSPWPIDAWQNCADPEFKVDPTKQVFAAFDITPRRNHASLVLGQVLDSGKIGLSLVQTWETETSLDDLNLANGISEWVRKFEISEVAYSKNTASNVAARLQSAGIQTKDIDGRVFAQACDELLSAMTNKRIAHADQTEFNKHIVSSARIPFAGGDGWVIGRRASNAVVNGAVAAAMVVHMGSKQIAEIDILVA